MDEASNLFEEVLAFGDEALATFDRAADHFEHKTDRSSRSQRASALVKKAGILGALGRQDEALVALNDVIAQYEHDDAEGIQGMIAVARSLREDFHADD